jgi:hypothetical protein
MLSFAQKSSVYADGGICLAYFYPGYSITYNYTILKHLGIGMGIQGYTFHTTIPNEFQFTPALYTQLRYKHFHKKRESYFFIDFGANYYAHSNKYWNDATNDYSISENNGTYIGLGCGRNLKPTLQGWQPYWVVKIISNFYRVNDYNITTAQQSIVGRGDATLVVSVGLKL